MASLNIRSLDDETDARLKAVARERGVSVNRQALEMLRRGLGLGPPGRGGRHTDLDHLAGTWTPEDAAELAQALSALEQVDEGLWR